jgi:hypothetical protein
VPGFQPRTVALNVGGSARPLRKRQSEQVQYVTSRKVETRIQSRSFEFSGVAFLGQMMALGTRPGGVSVQVPPSASEPLGPHTINTTISVPIAAMMPISARYFRTLSSPEPGRGRDTTPEGTPILRSVPKARLMREPHSTHLADQRVSLASPRTCSSQRSSGITCPGRISAARYDVSDCAPCSADAESGFAGDGDLESVADLTLSRPPGKPVVTMV